MVESKHKWKAWLYLSPAIILLLVFTIWPIINTVRVSFIDGYNNFGNDTYVLAAAGDKHTVLGPVKSEDPSMHVQFIPSDNISSAADSSGVSSDDAVIPEVGTAYKLYITQRNMNNTVYYLTGVSDGEYMGSTENAAEGADFYIKAVGDGYNLYCMVDGAKKYVNIVKDDGEIYIRYGDKADTVWTIDGSKKTVVADEPLPIGFGNFKAVITYSKFLTALKNTVLLCVLTVPISTFLALLIAVCLNAIKPLQRFLQTVFFLPYVTNSIAIGMVFYAMFGMVGTAFGFEDEMIISPGIINEVLDVFGIGPVNWINSGSSYWANIFVLVVYIVWNALPFKILILLGGLQSINKQYYEAARVDGTGRVRTFTRITVPLLSPMLAYVIITGFIGGFKEYSSIVGIFGDSMGPAGDPYRLQTMVGYVYQVLPDGHAGRAGAAALILFVIIFAVTLVNLAVSKKKTHY